MYITIYIYIYILCVYMYIYTYIHTYTHIHIKCVEASMPKALKPEPLPRGFASAIRVGRDSVNL